MLTKMFLGTVKLFLHAQVIFRRTLTIFKCIQNNFILKYIYLQIIYPNGQPYESTDVIFIWRNRILFWVISAIDKKAWIELIKNSICAFHYNTMLVCFHKLIIKQKFPYCMDELLFKMCSQRGGDILSKNSIKGLFNIVGKLWECSIEEWLTKKITYRLHINKVVCGKWRWFWMLILCLISP